MKKSTFVRSLLLCGLSMLLCLSMLAGTTFAWFTDEVASGNNTIMAGNLDVELYNGLDNTADKVTTDTKLFRLSENHLWEPGAVVFENLTVANEGNLALKYQLSVNIGNAKGSKNLADVLKVGVVADGIDENATREEALDEVSTWMSFASFVKSGKLYPAGSTEGADTATYGIVIWWEPSDVDNDYNMNNGKGEALSIDLGVTLRATQVEAEDDSFGKDYDADAWMEGMQITNASDLQAAINAGETDLILVEDIVLDEPIVIPAAATTFSLRAAAAPAIVLDLNGKTINAGYAEGSTTNHVYALENYGNLIIVGNGTINARGIYNYGTITLESGTINAIDGNGGYGIKNYAGATLVMNGGTIATTLEDDNQVSAGGYDATTVRVEKGATFEMNGGVINNVCDYTFAIENYGTATINAGSVSSVHSTVANYGTLTVNGGEFICNGVEGNTQHVIWADAGTTTINGGTFDGKDTYNGFNVDASEGAIVNIYGGNFLPVHSGSLYGEGTITVYGGSFANDVTDRVAEGYSVVNNNNIWNVIKGDVVAGDNGSLNDAIANGEENIALGAGDFSMPTTSGDVTISGTKDTVITIDKPKANKVTLNGVTVIGSGNYTGIQHSDTVIYENCVIKGVQFLYANTVIFKNCTIDLTEKADYIWTYDAKNVEFIDCTFNTAGKAILIYHEGASTQTNVTVTGCTFNATASALASGHVAAAIEIDSSLSTSGHYTLTTSNNVVDSDFSGEWRVKKSGKDNTTVNGVIYNKVDDGLYKGTDNTYYVYNANGLKAINDIMANKSAGVNVVINLLNDIDFTGKTWTPVDSHIDWNNTLKEFNGNGHTISNLTINGQAMFTRFANNHDVVFKNVTFDNANLKTSSINTAIITGQCYDNLTLDNVDVINSTIEGGYKVGTYVGSLHDDDVNTGSLLLIKDCDVSSTVVTSNVYDFGTCGFVGFVYEGQGEVIKFENSTISDTEIVSKNPNGYALHAFLYMNDADTDDLKNEAEGVTVSGCTFENN